MYHFFLDSTCKRYHIFVFLWLTSLSMIISRSIHVAANGLISFKAETAEHLTITGLFWVPSEQLHKLPQSWLWLGYLHKMGAYEGNSSLRESGGVDGAGGEGLWAEGVGEARIQHHKNVREIMVLLKRDWLLVGPMSLSMVQGSSWLWIAYSFEKGVLNSKAVSCFFFILLKISLNSYIRIKINVRLFYFYILYFLSKARNLLMKTVYVIDQCNKSIRR